MNDELKLVIEFMKSKKVSLSYMSKKVSIPYGSLNFYRSKPESLKNLNTKTFNELYNFVKDIGVEKIEDINKIQHKEEYFVNK